MLAKAFAEKIDRGHRALLPVTRRDSNPLVRQTARVLIVFETK